MTNTIFDLVEGDLPEGKEGYMEFANRAPIVKDTSFLNTISDYSKTILKGSVEGISKLGRMMGPTMERPDVLIGGKKSQITPEEQTEQLDIALPTDEGFVQKGLRRGLREAPSVMAFPGGSALQTLPRAMAAGFLGEGAKELGAPEWAQAALELTAYIGPDIAKKLLSSGKDKELIEFAKKMGMTDEQVTPLIQSEFKQKWLSKLVPKRGSTQTALQNTKKALSEAYSSIQQSVEAAKEVLPGEGQKLLSSLREIFFKMPASVRNKIKPDMVDLAKKPITSESLINLFSDINQELGPKTKQLSLFKKPIKEAIGSISPELKSDFEMINKLYERYYPIAGRLKPNLMSDIIQAGEALGLAGAGIGALFGHYPSLIAIAGEKAGKFLAKQLILNPRFQQLSKKMTVAINQNKFTLARKVIEDFKNEISKFDPESAGKIENISEKEFEKLIKYQE